MSKTTTADAPSMRLMTVRELAQTLSISPRCAWRLSALREVGIGSFPQPVRLSRKLTRWRARDVAAYLDGLAGGRGP